MRSLLSLLSVLALAACEPPSGSESGVGFQDYSAYQEQQAYLARSRAAREGPPLAALPPGPVAPGAPLTALAPAGSSPGMPPSESQVIAAQTLTALGRAPEVGAPPPPPPSPVMAPAPLPAQTAAPTASSGANIVAYALSTSHPVGQQMYRRSGLGPSRFERNCAQYASDGLAQEAFLSRGGPERDPLGIDPDGDGYACRWDPTPFRAARG